MTQDLMGYVTKPEDVEQPHVIITITPEECEANPDRKALLLRKMAEKISAAASWTIPGTWFETAWGHRHYMISDIRYFLFGAPDAAEFCRDRESGTFQFIWL